MRQKARFEGAWTQANRWGRGKAVRSPQSPYLGYTGGTSWQRVAKHFIGASLCGEETLGRREGHAAATGSDRDDHQRGIRERRSRQVFHDRGAGAPCLPRAATDRQEALRLRLARGLFIHEASLVELP